MIRVTGEIGGQQPAASVKPLQRCPCPAIVSEQRLDLLRASRWPRSFRQGSRREAQSRAAMCIVVLRSVAVKPQARVYSYYSPASTARQNLANIFSPLIIYHVFVWYY
jgi:hypothetical protein